MTNKQKLLLATGLMSVALIGSNPAFAAGTTAGTDITNNVTVSFAVGGVTQNDKTQSNTFEVDRKVVFTVSEKTTVGTTSVSPGQVDQIVAYTVSNTSNDTIGFSLGATNSADGTIAESGSGRGTDNSNVTITAICVDSLTTGTVGVCDAGEKTLGSTSLISNLTADASTTVWVFATVPLTLQDEDVANITLTATARQADGSSAFTDIAGSGDANTDMMQTVFAETGAGTHYDGVAWATDDYTLDAAVLSVAKYSRVISDPMNSTEPKAVPGAVVEYCIAVTNAAGAATATGISVQDDISALELDYVAAFGVKLNGTSVTGNTCAAGTDSGAEAAGVISGTLSDVAASETRTLVFRATIR